MPRKKKADKVYVAPVKNKTKTGKERRITRRKEENEPIPKFIINGAWYISTYDIRNFLREKQKSQEKDLIYEFRKKKQTMERHTSEDFFKPSRSELIIDEEYEKHINPNSTACFIKYRQFVKPEEENPEFEPKLEYLVKDMKMEIADLLIKVTLM